MHHPRHAVRAPLRAPGFWRTRLLPRPVPARRRRLVELLLRAVLAVVWFGVQEATSSGALQEERHEHPAGPVAGPALPPGGLVLGGNAPSLWPEPPGLSAAVEVGLGRVGPVRGRLVAEAGGGTVAELPDALGPLRWAPYPVPQRAYGSTQVVGRMSLRAELAGRAAPAAYGLWWRGGAVGVQGGAWESLQTLWWGEEAARFWSGRGWETAVGFVAERDVGGGWAAGVEAAAGGANWRGALEQTATRTDARNAGTRWETVQGGLASGGIEWGYVAARLGRAWRGLEAALGLGWSSQAQWASQLVEPGRVFETDARGTRELPGGRGDVNRVASTWRGLVSGGRLVWRPFPELAVGAWAAAWRGTSTRRASAHLRRYQDGRLLYEEPLLAEESTAPGTGWTWGLELAAHAGAHARWRIGVGPGGRFALALGLQL